MNPNNSSEFHINALAGTVVMVAFLAGAVSVADFWKSNHIIEPITQEESFSMQSDLPFVAREKQNVDAAILEQLEKETTELKEMAYDDAAAALQATPGATGKDLASIAKNRKASILKLLEQDPSRVRTLLITKEERAALPTGVQADVEQYVELSGTLEASIFESMPENAKPYHKKLFALMEGAKRSYIYFGDAEPTSGNGARVKIKGYRLDNKIIIPEAAQGFEFDAAFNNAPAFGPQEAAVAEAAISGTKPFKVAVILFNFSDDTSQPTDFSFWRDAVYTGGQISLRNFYKEVSFGKMIAEGAVNASTGDLYGYVTIAAPKSVCNQYLWADQAQAAAAANGYVASRYDSVILVHPRASSCPYDGGGDLGSTIASDKAPRTWINGNFIKEVLHHEVGHNLGVMHANLRICTSTSGGATRVAFSNFCSQQEYGDILDIMGYRIFRHPSAFMKQKIGLLSSGNIKTITAKNGTYTLYPIEQTTAQPQGLRISRNSSEWIYIDYRQPSGYDNYPGTHPAVKGISVRIVPKNGAATYLLDTTPGSKPLAGGYYTYTPDFEDGALGIGKTISIGAIKIKTVSAGATAKVQVTLP